MADFELVDDAVVALAQNILHAYHSHLAETKIVFLMRSGEWNSKDRKILGKAKILSTDMRRLMNVDAVIYLNQSAWNAMSEKQQKYLIDHELSHLEVQIDRNEETKYDEVDKRPILKSVSHDLEDFSHVVKRHGLVMEDIKRFATAMSSANQLNIWDYLGDSERKNVVKFRMAAGDKEHAISNN